MHIQHTLVYAPPLEGHEVESEDTNFVAYVKPPGAKRGWWKRVKVHISQYEYNIYTTVHTEEIKRVYIYYVEMCNGEIHWITTGNHPLEHLHEGWKEDRVISGRFFDAPLD